MNKLYMGLSLFLLIAVLVVGLWAISYGGIPEIGLRSFEKGEYGIQFHKGLASNFPFGESMKDWNLLLNQFYTFTGFSKEKDMQMLVPIINDGADHGAAIPVETMDMEESMDSENIPVVSETVPHSDDPLMNENEPSPTEYKEQRDEVKAEALGQILLVGDRAMELPKPNFNGIKQYSQAVSDIAYALDGVNVYSILVPNSAGIYAPEEYQQGEDSQLNMIDYAYDHMDDGIQKVDAYSTLKEHQGEYIFFRTDHHWTHLGSYYAYNAFCKEAGITPNPLSDFTVGAYDSFLGTMYSFLSGYSQREILKEHPDSLIFYEPKNVVSVRYYDSPKLSYGGKIPLIYPVSENYSNKYISFLGGDHPVTIIETDVPGDRTCLLIKESYGNAFATWLTGHYSKIICIDPREFNRKDKPTLDLKEFSSHLGIDDCIILNYPLMINSDAYGSWLDRLIP